MKEFSHIYKKKNWLINFFGNHLFVNDIYMYSTTKTCFRLELNRGNHLCDVRGRYYEEIFRIIKPTIAQCRKISCIIFINNQMIKY